MNIKNILCTATIAANIICIATESDPRANLDELRRQGAEIRAAERRRGEEQMARRMQGLPTLPSDPMETPTSAKPVFHSNAQSRKRFGRPYNLHEARIFFGTDESGKPCYRAISQHAEKNPEFSKVEVVIYDAPRLRNWYKESFEKIGTVADEDAREQLLENISDYDGILLWKHPKGGVWCPTQNAFVGGTQDTSMCDRFADYLKQQPTESEAKK